MLLENTHALKEFLMLNLGKICDADPAALTKYIMALLKKNRSENELKAFLLDQLEVFLQHKTLAFVDILLTALKTKAYIENVPVAPEVTPHDSSLPVEKCTLKTTHKVSDSTLKEREGDSTPHTTHQKKKHTIPDSSEYERRGITPTTPPSSPMRAHTHDSPKLGSVSEMSEHENNAKDGNNILFSQNSVLGTNYIKRCDNYDQLGYCLKGSLCSFDHGCDPILVEDVSALSAAPFLCEVNTPDGGGGPTPPLPTTSPPPLPPLPPVFPPPLEPYNPECPAITYSPFCMPSVQSGPQRMKPQRTRVLQVPTSTHTQHREDKRKPFDFSRLGPPPKKLARFKKVCEILEIRNIPKNLNTISLLNSHFSKFGRIVNIEVAYEGDPEAALIKYASPVEAVTAFRSSVAIFNNRFIKVFYHGGAPPTHTPSNFGGLDKKSEKNSTGILVSRRGESFCTPHNPSLSPNPPTERIFQKSPLFSPDNHSREVKKEENKVAKKLDLLRKKQHLLKCSVNAEKVILAKLIKCKKKKEKDFLKKTIDQIASKISTLKSEIEKEACVLKKELVGKKSLFVAAKSEKELLDVEMDFYKERKPKVEEEKSKETAKLLSQVNELKEKAKSLGFIEGSLPSNPRAKHAEAKVLKKSSVHTHTHEGGEGVCVSHPRQVLVSSSKDKEELLKHFEREQFGPIERIEDKNSYKLITFSSRLAAEAAFSHKIDDMHLVWYQDSHTQHTHTQLSNENMDQSTGCSESKPINSEILGDDEEEDEEEARSWRR